MLAAAITASFTVRVFPYAPGTGPSFSVPAETGFVILFWVTAAVAIVGFALSLGLRNYRFRADGTRFEVAAGQPAAMPPVEPAPAVSADRSS